MGDVTMGQAIRRRRLASTTPKGVDFARAVSLSPSQLSRYENDLSPVTTEAREAIEAFLGLARGELLFDVGLVARNVGAPAAKSSLTDGLTADQVAMLEGLANELRRANER